MLIEIIAFKLEAQADLSNPGTPESKSFHDFPSQHIPSQALKYERYGQFVEQSSNARFQAVVCLVSLACTEIDSFHTLCRQSWRPGPILSNQHPGAGLFQTPAWHR